MSFNIRVLPPFWYGVLHFVVATIVVGVAVATRLFPTWGDITLGTALYGLLNWLEAVLAK